MCLPFLCGGDDPVRQPAKNNEVQVQPPPTAARPAEEDIANDSNGHKPSPVHGGAVNGNGGHTAAPVAPRASYPPDADVRTTPADKQSTPKEGEAGKTVTAPSPTVVPAASQQKAPAEAKRTHGGAAGDVARRNGISSPILTAPPMEAMAPTETVQDAPPPPPPPPAAAAATAANDVHGDAEQRRGHGDQGGAAAGEDHRKPRRRSWL